MNWRIALTMIFGSMVGGGTSEGGGAIAFPVFTKLLHIAPIDARNFSLGIQSIGMVSASLSILYLKIPIERRALLYAGVAGLIGVTIGALFVAPHASPPLVRASFTVLVSSLGLAVLLMNLDRQVLRNDRIPIFGNWEKLILVFAGLVGGIISALVGCGENTIAFMVMVLLFRMDEKVVTPTTVILMSIVTIPGFLLHLFVIRDFGAPVMGYWLAAVPVVAVGGPLGALICSYMPRRAIVILLLSLIALEFVSTLALVSLSKQVLWASSGAFALFGSVAWAMSSASRYRPGRL
ncbi:putative membrane protein YfcA [Granulicella aggregans]|uniref:Probable membrane transporter protein n=2 Tax=Granulicella aggregans TaxID=474949 RepID=A0A7W8E2W6_9BACT|nr:putative membrane protein YfcA [Granulicella aggregans]